MTAQLIMNLIVGLSILLYMGFTATTIYLVVVGKRTHDMDWIGRLLWYHGMAWILIMICTVIASLSIVFSQFIGKAIGM